MDTRLSLLDYIKPPTYLVPYSMESDWHQHTNGGGWVFHTASVAKTAYVGPKAVVFENAILSEFAVLTDSAYACGNAVMTEHVCIGGKSIIYGHAIGAGSARIFGDTHIRGRAFIGGNAIIDGVGIVIEGYTSIITGVIEFPLTHNAAPRTSIDKVFRRMPCSLPDLAENFSPRTQKAKGIHALCIRGMMTNKVRFQKIETADPEKMLNRFVRPCPISPRHGFVDSRIVNTLEEAVKIVEETKTADEKAEFIVMPYVESSYSGIFTPGLMSVGRGNDGATSGTSSVSFPAIGYHPEINKQDHPSLFEDAGIKESEYIELLWAKGEEGRPAQTVQLRDGPVVSQETDFIPRVVTVAEVIKAEGNLLEWEAKMKTVAPNTIVWHPDGSMASHYAVHCYLNKVPVAISFEPKIGDVIEPKTDSKEINLDLLRAGFIHAQRISVSTEYLESIAHAARIMLAALHHVPVWAGRYDYLIGIGMGFAYRLTIIASLGEYRHNRSVYSGARPSRDAVYMDYWSKTLAPATKTRFTSALKSFNCDYWSSAYGGTAWYTFAKHATDMLNFLIKGEVTESIEAFNRCVNAAHNNGWAFNKFCSTEFMTATVKNPVTALLWVGPCLLEAVTTSKDIPLMEKYLIDFSNLKKYPDIFEKAPEPANAERRRREAECDPIAELQIKPVGNTHVHVQYRYASQVGKKKYQSADIRNHSSISQKDIHAEGEVKIWKDTAFKTKSMNCTSNAEYYGIGISSSGLLKTWNTVNLYNFFAGEKYNDKKK